MSIFQDDLNIEDVENKLDLDPDDWFSNRIEAGEESEKEIIDKNDKLILPFDPKKIKIATATVPIYSLMRRLQRTEIDLYPRFQRKANLWDKVRKSRLIESLLLEMPLPAFYFDIESEEKWLVVDGLQRLSTLKHFMLDVKDPLSLEGLDILRELEGKTFKTLNNKQKQQILDTNVTIFKIQEGTPKAVKYNIFARINTGGLGLTPMEIRHALNQKGTATDFFEQLEHSNSFFKSFSRANKVPTSRMEDRELALRYVAFSLPLSYSDYNYNLGKFLDKAMENLDQLSCTKLLIDNLEKSIDCYEQIFGNTRFGRGITRKAMMNSALFEVWTSELAKLSDEQRIQLVSKKQDIINDYKQLLSNLDFLKAIISRTSAKSAVEMRFKTIHQLIYNQL